MSLFQSIPPLNISQAPSTQCSFNSPAFVRALLRAMAQRDFDAVLAGLDKALQLGLAQRDGGRSTNNPDAASAAGGNGTAADGSSPSPSNPASPCDAVVFDRATMLLRQSRILANPDDEVTAAGCRALPLSCVLHAHPTLSLFGDWLNFIDTQGFSTLQAQHCLGLLTELLAALGRADPDSDSDSPAGNGNSNHTCAAASPLSGESPAGRKKQQHEQPGPHPAGSVDGASDLGGPLASAVPALGTTSSSCAPPECVIDTLTSFLSRSCARHTILIVDEVKVAEAAASAKEAAAAAAAAAAETSPLGKDAAGRAKRGARANTMTKSERDKQSQQLQEQQLSASVNASSANLGASHAASTVTEALSQSSPQQQSQQQQSQQAMLLVDPNPHVKEIIVDPVFCAAEVRAICAFVAETVFLHWRLISVLQRAPDGLTVPSTIGVVVEHLPVGGVPKTIEGISQRQYNDTLARMQAYDDACEGLAVCFEAALVERDATILPEYERSTAVANRRDKVIREDDMRKQMKPEEFKRTVKVLERVMDPRTVLQKLSEAEAQQKRTNGIVSALKGGNAAASPASTVNSLSLTTASEAAASSGPPVLTLEQRLERLEQASLPHHASVSPGGAHRSRHHHR